MDRYYKSFASYLRERFGEKVFRVSLDAGFTCPNRDGTVGSGGCAFCAGEGSWSTQGRLPSKTRVPLAEQVREGKERARRRYGASKYIAYFQAFSNTYAPIERLRETYDSVLAGDDDFVALAVGTRPDCVDEKKLALLASYGKRGLEVWVEYGLQSARDSTLAAVGRGHTVSDFSRAVRATRSLGVKVSAHVILGLPGEGSSEARETAELLADLSVEGVKIHNLNILRGTRMAEWYAEGKVKPLGLREYAALVVDFLERTRPDTVVERLAADTDPRLLLEPRWALCKDAVLDAIRNEFRARESFQGKLRSG